MGTRRKSRYQCVNCGTIYVTKDPPYINEDELCVKMRCKKCQQMGNHLWVGLFLDETYLYYDLNADPRFYEYNTK